MKKDSVIAYRCIEDCTLDYTNFDDGEIIEIPGGDEVPNNWKGTDFFDNHPYEFEKVYESQSFILRDFDDNEISVVGDMDEAKKEFKKQKKWKTFYEYCEMELPQLYYH